MGGIFPGSVDKIKSLFPFHRPRRSDLASAQRRSPMNASTRKQTQPDAQPASYEQATAELEQLVQQLESGQMSLDDTLKSYQRGALLLQYCREKLQAVEQQIQILDGSELKPYASDRQTGN